MSSPYTPITGRVRAVTDRALLVFTGPRPSDEVWIPRSVVEDGDDVVLGEDDLSVREWFARKENLA